MLEAGEADQVVHGIGAPVSLRTFTKVRSICAIWPALRISNLSQKLSGQHGSQFGPILQFSGGRM